MNDMGGRRARALDSRLRAKLFAAETVAVEPLESAGESFGKAFGAAGRDGVALEEAAPRARTT